MAQTIYVRAPVTGVVGEVRVGKGDDVSQGVLLAIQAAAKTEAQVTSPVTGRVKTIAGKGAALAAGDVLAEIEC
ncbi:hypothetical protein BV22DRAFT_1128189 [Leucogyrophana mollusca]|uniref:Uncharacterized protein n=1 Tax=Leucogyrophana mollusca TaxID=85980 RepID=A0ACB8BLM7_9AGAM|nr:hypothetical protein BV22DRAFT_1128189 [Leucogyrophana mollusca]